MDTASSFQAGELASMMGSDATASSFNCVVDLLNEL